MKERGRYIQKGSREHGMASFFSFFILLSLFYSLMSKSNRTAKVVDSYDFEDDHKPSFLYYGKTTYPNKFARTHSSAAILDLSCCQNEPSGVSAYSPAGVSCRHQSIIEPHWEMPPSDIHGAKDIVDDSWWTILFETRLVPVSRGKEWPIVFTYIILFLLMAIMSGEFVMNRELSGEFFELDPFNIMIGPSAQTLIQTGARYPPCMRNTTAMPSTNQYICFSKPYEANGHAGIKDDNNQPDFADFNNPRQSLCTLQEVCGMGGFLQPQTPDQTFRFITPLFVHPGLVPLLCNLAALMWIGRSLERIINSMWMMIVYFGTGAFGNIFGAYFTSITTLSAGSSAAVLGLAGCLLVDFAFTWRHLARPVRHFAKVMIAIGMCFMLGILPGADNFSHVGGFLSGLLLGVWAVPPLAMSPRRRNFYWAIRIIAAITFVVAIFVLSQRFFHPDYQYCPDCRDISCMPLNGSCKTST
ncbi:hypothetical protein BX666DRAFT_1959344 [Dichotomocladium elegans]|nr:hypothetical protein BX666DRAFT_1959344 [Dichotomocladium elegans]